MSALRNKETSALSLFRRLQHVFSPIGDTEGETSKLVARTVDSRSGVSAPAAMAVRHARRFGRAGYVVLVVVMVVGAGLFVWLSNRDPAVEAGYRARACALEDEVLHRIARGYHPERSNDVTMVPDEPNFVGSFTLTSHSGPWDYVQDIPLVLYGPDYVPPAGRVKAEVDLTDVYPTIGRLLGLDLPEVDGTVLPGASSRRSPQSPPKLVVVVVWDGAGRRTLEEWPSAWPTLAEMEENGVSYVEATVGSSPSVTSAIHSTLGTGAYPNHHGIPANDLRLSDGRVAEAFEGLSTEDLLRQTFADVVDREFDNLSNVGLLAWVKWHVGMLSHGEAATGGDADEMAMIGYLDEVIVSGNERYFDVPKEIADGVDIESSIDEVDREDGVLDGKWLGNDITLPQGRAPWDTYSNPAWARFQTELVFEMLQAGDYGEDNVPDIFLTNFKMTDLAGHKWGISSEETRETLQAQDDALAEILDYLEREVGDYVVVVTADHGASPLPAETGAWPIDQRELIKDLDENFDISEQSLVAESSASGLHLDREVTDGSGVSAADVASFLTGYTIAENSSESSLPDGYQDRADELVMSAAFPTSEIDELVKECS